MLSATSISNDEQLVAIHVDDPVRCLHHTFQCSKTLLVSRVSYFTKINMHEPITIENCDLGVFDWLIRWVHNEGPPFAKTDVLHVLLLALFLNIDTLIQQSLDYCLRERVCVTDISNKDLLKLVPHLSATHLQGLRGLKDHKMFGRLFFELLATWLDRTNLKRGNFCDLNQLFWCVNCSTIVHQKKLNSIITCQHTKDTNWKIEEHIKDLHKKIKSWQKVYWLIWEEVHFFLCSKCQLYFAVNQVLKGSTKYSKYTRLKRSDKSLGRYPCCGGSASKQDFLHNVSYDMQTHSLVDVECTIQDTIDAYLAVITNKPEHNQKVREDEFALLRPIIDMSKLWRAKSKLLVVLKPHTNEDDLEYSSDSNYVSSEEPSDISDEYPLEKEVKHPILDDKIDNDSNTTCNQLGAQPNLSNKENDYSLTGPYGDFITPENLISIHKNKYVSEEGISLNLEEKRPIIKKFDTQEGKRVGITIKNTKQTSNGQILLEKTDVKGSVHQNLSKSSVNSDISTESYANINTNEDHLLGEADKYCLEWSSNSDTSHDNLYTFAQDINHKNIITDGKNNEDNTINNYQKLTTVTEKEISVNEILDNGNVIQQDAVNFVTDSDKMIGSDSESNEDMKTNVCIMMAGRELHGARPTQGKVVATRADSDNECSVQVNTNTCATLIETYEEHSLKQNSTHKQLMNLPPEDSDTNVCVSKKNHGQMTTVESNETGSNREKSGNSTTIPTTDNLTCFMGNIVDNINKRSETEDSKNIIVNEGTLTEETDEMCSIGTTEESSNSSKTSLGHQTRNISIEGIVEVISGTDEEVNSDLESEPSVSLKTYTQVHKQRERKANYESREESSSSSDVSCQRTQRTKTNEQYYLWQSNLSIERNQINQNYYEHFQNEQITDYLTSQIYKNTIRNISSKDTNETACTDVSAWCGNDTCV